jgi:hypothetical protein
MNKKLLVCMVSIISFLGLLAGAQGVVSGFGVPEWIKMDVTMVNQIPDPVEPGQYVELRFKFENRGSENAEDIVVELIPEYPFSLEPGESVTKYIGSVHGRQIGDIGTIVKYRVKVDENAVEGENDIELKYKINKAGYPPNWIKLDTFTVDIQTHDAIMAVEDVKLVPKEFVPGQSGSLTITLKNMADSVLKEIKTKLEVSTTNVLTTSVATTDYPFTPIGSTNEKTIGLLEAKESVDIEFNLVADPDAEANIYKVPLTIKYSDELGTNYTKNLIIGLIIGGEPDLAINLDDSTITSSGAKGTVTIKFVNKGTNDVKFCYVKLRESDEYEILSPSEDYIGSIDSDDYETVDFDLYVSSKESEIFLPLTVEYKDANNKEYTEEIKIPLKLYSSSEAKKYGVKKGNSAVGIIIILIIVGAGLFFYIRKKRKTKKEKNK